MDEAKRKWVGAWMRKAFTDLPIKKTHDVDDLVELALASDLSFQDVRDDADVVQPFATRFRYPSIGDSDLEPSRADLDEALTAARRIYNFVPSKLPPETHSV